MLFEALNAYVGRQITRKSDGVRGVINALYHADNAQDPELRASGDMIFEFLLDNGETAEVVARQSTIESQDFEFVIH